MPRNAFKTVSPKNPAEIGLSSRARELRPAQIMGAPAPNSTPSARVNSATWPHGSATAASRSGRKKGYVIAQRRDKKKAPIKAPEYCGRSPRRNHARHRPPMCHVCDHLYRSIPARATVATLPPALIRAAYGRGGIGLPMGNDRTGTFACDRFAAHRVARVPHSGIGQSLDICQHQTELWELVHARR